MLDLDETLVHSSFQAVRADAGVSFFTIPVEIEHSVHDINVIRRPGLDEFLRAVGRSGGHLYSIAGQIRKSCG